MATGSFARGQGAAKPPEMSAQDKAREFIRLTGELRGLFDQKKWNEAAAVCRKMSELVPQAAEPYYNLACSLAHLDKKDDALAALAKAAECGFNDVATVEKDADLTPLRGDKRFADALAKVKANDAARTDKGEPIAGVKTVEDKPEGGLAYRLRMSPDATKQKPNRLLVWLHPSGGSMNKPVEAMTTRFLQRGYALLVFTKKDFRFWGGDDSVRLAKTLDLVSKIEGISDDRPVLMGFSAGGQMALELWSTNPEGLGGLILDAAYPIHSMIGPQQSAIELPKSEPGRKVPMFVLVGTKDGGCPLWKRVEPDWLKGGVPLTVRYIEGRGHEWLVGAAEADALDKWLGDAPAAAPALPAGKPAWRPNLVGAATSAAAGLIKFAEGQDSITVPVERGGYLLLAKVTLNGQDAGWFIVDTGAQMTMVATKTALSLNLPVVGHGRIQGIGGTRAVALRKVDSLSLGELTMGTHTVIDLDLEALSAPVGMELGGVLGADLWSQVPFTVDWQARSITFHNPARFKPPTGAAVETMTIDKGRPNVRAVLGGTQEGSFSLDTAATRFLYLAGPMASQHPELFEAGPGRTVAALGPAGQDRLALKELKALKVLGRTFSGVQVQYPPTAARGEGTVGGILGSPMLEHFRLTFDYANKQVYVEPAEVLSVKERLAKGLKPNDKDFLGLTPLHMAAGYGHKADVEALLAAKADLKAGDNMDRTPLYSGAAYGGPEVVKLLLALGADVKAKATDGKTPLLAAAEYYQTDSALALLADKADVNAADAGGSTPLIYAALTGNTDLVKALLAAKADVAAAMADGKTALMACSQTDNAEIAQTLIAAKSDVNAQDKQGGTAVMYAAFMGRQGMLDALIAAKADVNLKTAKGESALKIAKVCKFQNIVDALEKAGAKE
jgi:ankyrin repeat protein/predicted esterase